MVDDLDEGYDVRFNRSGKDARTNYTGVEVDRDATPLHEDDKILEKWLAYTLDHPLQGILNFYEPEHIEKVLRGRASARRDEDAGDAAKGDAAGDRGSRGRRAAGRRPAAASTPSGDEERDYMEEGAAANEADYLDEGDGGSSAGRRRGGDAVAAAAYAEAAARSDAGRRRGGDDAAATSGRRVGGDATARAVLCSGQL
jgi:hypothetical protein